MKPDLIVPVRNGVLSFDIALGAGFADRLNSSWPARRAAAGHTPYLRHGRP